MDQDTVEALAKAICKEFDNQRKQWWVEPETHYNQHKEIAEILKDYKEVRSMFWRIVLRCIIAGAAVLAFVGVNVSNLSKYLPK